MNQRRFQVSVTLIPMWKLKMLMTICAMVFLTRFLLACGDIESNPGPAPQEVLQRSVQNELLLNYVAEEQTKAFEREQTLVESISFLKEEINRLELLAKKNNLKFLGIHESPNETQVMCVQKLVDILNEAGQFSTPFLTTDIQETHRIKGRGRWNSPCPLIVRFTQWRDKVGILQDKFLRDNLRADGIRVASDLTRQQSAKISDLRKQGIHGYFLNGRLRTSKVMRGNHFLSSPLGRKSVPQDSHIRRDTKNNNSNVHQDVACNSTYNSSYNAGSSNHYDQQGGGQRRRQEGGHFPGNGGYSYYTYHPYANHVTSLPLMNVDCDREASEPFYESVSSTECFPEDSCTASTDDSSDDNDMNSTVPNFDQLSMMTWGTAIVETPQESDQESDQPRQWQPTNRMCSNIGSVSSNQDHHQRKLLTDWNHPRKTIYPNESWVGENIPEGQEPCHQNASPDISLPVRVVDTDWTRSQENAQPYSSTPTGSIFHGQGHTQEDISPHHCQPHTGPGGTQPWEEAFLNWSQPQTRQPMGHSQSRYRKKQTHQRCPPQASSAPHQPQACLHRSQSKESIPLDQRQPQGHPHCHLQPRSGRSQLWENTAKYHEIPFTSPGGGQPRDDVPDQSQYQTKPLTGKPATKPVKSHLLGTSLNQRRYSNRCRGGQPRNCVPSGQCQPMLRQKESSRKGPQWTGYRQSLDREETSPRKFPQTITSRRLHQEGTS